MLLRMIREIRASSERFGSVLVIPFYVAKVFTKSVTYSRLLVSQCIPFCNLSGDCELLIDSK